jgi:hypothetical protein
MAQVKKTLNEAQFRGLVGRMVREYVANDDQNPHKDDHADPSGRNWDEGLDEDDEMQEAEKDHVDMRGAHKHRDPRWDDHADPSGREWDAGLDESPTDTNISDSIASKISNMLYQMLLHHFSESHLQKGTLEGICSNVETMIHRELDEKLL